VATFSTLKVSPSILKLCVASFRLPLPNLENPVSRHELEGILQRIGGVARLSDPCLKHKLILRDGLLGGGGGGNDSWGRKDNDLPQLDPRSMRPADDLIRKPKVVPI
jgi:hypothetical protein